MVLTKYALELTGKRLYDLISAVRGPDVANLYTMLASRQGYEFAAFDTLKRELTARVRHVVFGPSSQGPALHGAARLIDGVPYSYGAAWNDTPATQATCDTVRVACETIKNSSGYDHFAIHLRFAIDASHDHPIWGGQSFYLRNTL